MSDKLQKHSMEFGKKEKVLNYACQTYQLSRPNKVGAVMALIREKSVVNDGLAKIFVDVVFEESSPELDHAGDIDYIAKIGDKAIGIQIKPITAKANFGNYSPTERMKASFSAFEEEFGGKVFVVFSEKGEIANKDVIDEIGAEIEKLCD
jgi:hypothetical protein